MNSRVFARGLSAIASAVLLIAVAGAASAQEVIRLWPGVAPGSEGATWTEKVSKAGKADETVRNVTVPTLTVYRPEPGKANGTAVIVAPGGGFRLLSVGSEGDSVARWLAARGVTAFVLKYRLVQTPDSDTVFTLQFLQFLGKLSKDNNLLLQTMGRDSKLPMADARLALKLVREKAKVWGVDPHRVGMLGFSAGGVVTARSALAPDASARPDFAAVIYGVSPPAPVPAKAPPLFLVVAADDPLAVESTLRLHRDWQTAGLPVELHKYQDGGHGFGSKKQGKSSDQWMDAYENWLRSRGLLSRAK